MGKLLAILSCACTIAAGSLAAHNADSTPVRALLKKASDQYKALRAYEIEAKTIYLITQGGQTAMLERKAQLAVGENGAFRIEQQVNGVPELRMSDGTTTWKVLPKEKLWAKSQVAQAIAEDDDDSDMSSDSMGQDLFTQAQVAFVRRYSGLERLESVQIERQAKLKLNGEKVDCIEFRLPGKDSDHRFFIAKDSGWVVRHVEVANQKDGTHVKTTTDYTRIDTGIPRGSLFAFEPLKGGKEMGDVSLPSERNLSLVGQRAADFTLTSLDGGAPVHLAELQGKIVLLDFWATWCPPCRRELPTIEALSRKYKDKNVTVLGVNNEDQKIARKFLEQHHPDLATLHDEKGKVQRMYSCYAIPTVMVIDPSGKIVAHFVGERSESELVAALKGAGMR
jgi:peroxiredoxin